MKTYKSKEGLQFRISQNPLPHDGEIVYFTSKEYEWIKQQGLSSDEFRVLWLMKKDDFRYNPIPESEIEKSSSIGIRYAQEIKKMLKGGLKDVEPEQIRQEESK
jgi:hypothetical protein